MTARAVTFTPLTPKEHILAHSATVVWEPSVFGGDGTERRLNLVLRVADNVCDALRSIEHGAALDCSVVKDDTIKVKIDTQECRVWGADHLPSSPPEQWRGTMVHAAIEVRGYWKSRNSTGLSVVCTDIQFVANGIAPASSPFQADSVARIQHANEAQAAC